MKASIYLVVLLAGLVAANFELPFNFMVGFREEGELMINQQIRSEGPFTTQRNVTLSFFYNGPPNKILTGVVIRGNSQRFQVSNCFIILVNQE